MISASPLLAALLDGAAAADCEYRGGLTNHLPMALVALAALGADDVRLQTFAAAYALRLEPAPAAEPWPPGDAWPGRLGLRAAWPAYRSLFAEWLHEEAAGDVLRQVLPQLLQGVGGAAFHGAIRTASAVRVGHRAQLADGLAYWACRWMPLAETDPAPSDRPGTDMVDALLRLQRALPGWGSTRGLIFEQMQEVATLPAFQAFAWGLRVDGDTLPSLAVLAAEQYAVCGDFTVLHLVTSAHAVRELLAYVDDAVPRDAAVTAYARAFGAALVASGCALQPRSNAAALSEERPWPEIAAAACASDDDHAIKLVDSAREHERALGTGPWQAAASRAVAGKRG